MSFNKIRILGWLTFVSAVILNINCGVLNQFIDKSGTDFTIQIETDKPNPAEITELAVKVIQNRANAIGLKADVVNNPDQPNQLVVKIYGTNDLERVRKFLFTANQLELKQVVSSANPAPLQIYNSKVAAQQIANDQQEVLSYIARDETAPNQFVIVKKEAIIDGQDIRDAQAVRISDAPGYYISFSLKKESARKFGEWTGKNIYNYLAIVLDKKVISAPFIKSQIFDSGQIDGRFTKENAEDIALSLKSGYLPATMKILDEKQFGK
jgi:preprotein translocase subunit SecD